MALCTQNAALFLTALLEVILTSVDVELRISIKEVGGEGGRVLRGSDNLARPWCSFFPHWFSTHVTQMRGHIQ